jgi:Rap1a immunity proteins
MPFVPAKFPAKVHAKIAVFGVAAILITLPLLAQTTASNSARVASQAANEAPKDISDTGRIFYSTCAVIDRPVSQLSINEAIPYVHCVSYIGAIFDTMELYDSTGLAQHAFCAPEKQVTQRDELVRTVRRYIYAHPEISNEQTVYVARLALVEAFACSNAIK